jgi:hypothetical protein
MERSTHDSVDDIDKTFCLSPSHPQRSSLNEEGNGIDVDQGEITDDFFADMSVFDYEKALMGKRNRMLLKQLKNPIVYEEFNQFMANSKSLNFLYYFNIFYTFLYFPAVVINFVLLFHPLRDHAIQEGHEYDHGGNENDPSPAIFVLLGLSAFLGVMIVVVCWLFFFFQCEIIDSYFNSKTNALNNAAHQQMNQSQLPNPNSTAFSSSLKGFSFKSAAGDQSSRFSAPGVSSRLSHKDYELPHQFGFKLYLSYFKPILVKKSLQSVNSAAISQQLQGILFVILIFFHCLILLARVLRGKCDYLPVFFVIENWSCNMSSNANTLPLDSLFHLILIPIIFVVNIRETRIKLIQFAWLTTVCTLIASAAIVRSVHAMPLILAYMITSYGIMLDSYKQYLFFFLISRKLKSTLETNIRLADQNKATEMRHMIANVAHDLKTVSHIILERYFTR